MADSCCNTDFDTSALKVRQRRVLVQVLIINVLTFAMMVGGSLVSGSSSLLSGTLDNFGDALTYTFSLAVVAIALLALFLRSAGTVLVRAWRELRPVAT